MKNFNGSCFIKQFLKKRLFAFNSNNRIKGDSFNR